MIHTLPPETQIGLIQEEHNAHIIDDERYKQELEVLGWKLGHANNQAFRIFGCNPFADNKYKKQLEVLKHALVDLPADEQREVLEQIAEYLKESP